MIDFLNRIKDEKELIEPKKSTRSDGYSHNCIAAIRTVLADGVSMRYTKLMKATGYGRSSIGYATRKMVADNCLIESRDGQAHVFTLTGKG